MEIRREAEKRFDAKSKSYDPSKRVGADSSFNPDKFIEVNESERVESVDSNKLGDTLFIMKLISTLNQFGKVEVNGTNDGKITAIHFSNGFSLYVDLADFPSVKVGDTKYFTDVSAVGVLELALYIIRKYNYIGSKYKDILH